jgi:hypothetical protein
MKLPMQIELRTVDRMLPYFLNHCTCPYCQSNRQHAARRRQDAAGALIEIEPAPDGNNWTVERTVL